jgi:hypothetical protein
MSPNQMKRLDRLIEMSQAKNNALWSQIDYVSARKLIEEFFEKGIMEGSEEMTRDLHMCMGFVDDGTQCAIKIAQDDATREYYVTGGRFTKHSRSLREVIREYALDERVRRDWNDDV